MATFVRLLGWLRPYRLGLAVSAVLAAVAMVMTVAIPWLSGRAIDRVREGDRSGLTALGIAILGAGALRLALTIVRRLVAGRVSLGVARDGRPAVGALLPRLRPDLHAAVRADHPARGGRDDRGAARAGGDLADPGADRGLRGRAVRATLAPGAAGAPA